MVEPNRAAAVGAAGAASVPDMSSVWTRTFFPRGDGVAFDRVVFFSDAVFAIALTLAAVEIGMPELTGDANSVAGLWDAVLDKGHFHHRLLAMGLTQRQAVMLMYLISAGLGLSAILLTEIDGIYAVLLVSVIIACVCFCAKKIGILNDR